MIITISARLTSLFSLASEQIEISEAIFVRERIWETEENWIT